MTTGYAGDRLPEALPSSSHLTDAYKMVLQCLELTQFDMFAFSKKASLMPLCLPLPPP